MVLITTKKGKEGRVRVDYGFSATVKTPGLQPETMSVTEWADGLMQTLENDNNTSSVWYTYAQLAKQYAGRYINLSQSANPLARLPLQTWQSLLLPMLTGWADSLVTPSPKSTT